MLEILLFQISGQIILSRLIQLKKLIYFRQAPPIPHGLHTNQLHLHYRFILFVLLKQRDRYLQMPVTDKVAVNLIC